jgi:predicted ester cyclase
MEMAQDIRSVIEAYAHSHDPMHFAEDATFTQMAMPQPFTGRDVEVPMLGIYEVADGKIQRARLYYDMATLMRQLGQLA